MNSAQQVYFQRRKDHHLKNCFCNRPTHSTSCLTANKLSVVILLDLLYRISDHHLVYLEGSTVPEVRRMSVMKLSRFEVERELQHKTAVNDTLPVVVQFNNYTRTY